MKNRTAAKIVLKKRNINAILLILLAIMIVMIGVVLYNNSLKNSKKICIEDKTCFDVEIADNDEERALGLSGRNELDEDKGMLFIFEQETMLGFWMKDMKFPIDIIWISSDFTIAGIERDLQPCVDSCPIVYPSKSIKYVLEINANLSEKHNISENDKVSF